MGNFLFDAIIYLAAGVLCVPLAKKFGMSAVLGYIFAGVLIGPYVLGLIGQKGEDIMHFAEFGVVMMLFVVGLELEPKKFWHMRRYILGMGTFQFLGSVFLIFLFGVYVIGWAWNGALAIAFALALSSTAIVLQVLEEKDLSKTFAGRSSFAVLLYQDIAVIPILAILPLMGTMGFDAEAEHTLTEGLAGWLQALVVFGTILSVALAGRYVVIPLLRIVSKTHMHELFTAASLLLVFGVSYIMELVGLSPALGAFMAGVVLANSEFKHELEGNVAPFKGLLLGLFFIGVGASIDFPLIIKRPLFIFFFVLAIIIIKFVVLFALGKLYKKNVDQNFLFSFLLSQSGEFGFVILGFASTIHLLSSDLASTMMAVIAISMIFTPFLLLANERWVVPYLGVKGEVKDDKEYDNIDEENTVVIAGFGHFGSTLGRMLKVNGVKATVLDHNSERVKVLRDMGFKVFYGDASRISLLEAAGIQKAKVFVIAIDAINVTVGLIDIVRKSYPNVKIFARARTRNDAYELIDRGVDFVYREYLYGAIEASKDVLTLLGTRKYTATRQGHRFIQYDIKMTRKLATKRHDKKDYLRHRREEVALQEEVLKGDLYSSLGAVDHTWEVDIPLKNKEKEE